MTEKSSTITGYLYQCKDDTPSGHTRPHIVVFDKPSGEEGKILICSCFYNLPTPTQDFQPFTAKIK